MTVSLTQIPSPIVPGVAEENLLGAPLRMCPGLTVPCKGRCLGAAEAQGSLPRPLWGRGLLATHPREW